MNKNSSETERREGPICVRTNNEGVAKQIIADSKDRSLVNMLLQFPFFMGGLFSPKKTQEAFMEVCKAKQYDVCVMCGDITEYQKNQPITSRRDFIEGVGQLCSDCFTKTYGRETKEEYK